MSAGNQNGEIKSGARGHAAAQLDRREAVEEEEVSSGMLTVVPAALGPGEPQSIATATNAADVKQLFHHFPGLFSRLQPYGLRPLVQLTVFPSAHPFALLC